MSEAAKPEATWATVGAEPRVSATVIQTVGLKGWDGFCLIRVLD